VKYVFTVRETWNQAVTITMIQLHCPSEDIKSLID